MTIYKERANGKNEFWTYCDGQRVYLTGATATKELARGAKLVHVR